MKNKLYLIVGGFFLFWAIGLGIPLLLKGETTFQDSGTQNLKPLSQKWQYLSELDRNLLQQFTEDNQEFLEDWVGDPKRFRVYVYKADGLNSPLYLIDPKIECEEPACTFISSSNDIDAINQYYPFCNFQGDCRMMIYVKENRHYREVFSTLFWANGVLFPIQAERFFQFSKQIQNGLPICFQVTGMTDAGGASQFCKKTERMINLRIAR